MDTFKILYTFLGGLGIFFYGMKTMSNSLQAAAGNLIKDIISKLTTNRFLAVVVGVLVTMIVQSSSVTTVMVVGFVNAGLMKLAQAIGVILGANIGTTITGWIISIKVGKYGLLFIGLGIFPALFSKKSNFKNFGTCLFGIGLIFLGLQTMGTAFKPLRTNQEFISFLSYFSGQDYLSYFASILMGCLLTCIIQSSSAMLGITIALATTGVIEFHTAAALVLGENIGTTITALLASVGTTTAAKRAAKAHAVFNTLGVLIIFSVLPWYINFVDYLVPGDANALNAAGDKINIAVHIASSHTLFNVTATLVFLPFIKQIAQFVTFITPEKSKKEVGTLQVIGSVSDMVPATGISLVEAELRKMKDITTRSFELTREFLKDEKIDYKKFDKIQEYESITDRIQKEITEYSIALLELEMSTEQTSRLQSFIRIADEFESITDYLDKAAYFKTRFTDSTGLRGEAGEEFFHFFDKVKEFYHQSVSGLDTLDNFRVDDIERVSNQLQTEANTIRAHHLQRIASGGYEPASALTYSDIVVSLRKVRAHALNIAQATLS